MLKMEDFVNLFRSKGKRFDQSAWMVGGLIGEIKGTILTVYDNSEIWFYFDKEGKLNDVRSY